MYFMVCHPFQISRSRRELSILRLEEVEVVSEDGRVAQYAVIGGRGTPSGSIRDSF
jgi:hypothetical protein